MVGALDFEIAEVYDVLSVCEVVNSGLTSRKIPKNAGSAPSHAIRFHLSCSLIGMRPAESFNRLRRRKSRGVAHAPRITLA
jgi:hypothetical protein